MCNLYIFFSNMQNNMRSTDFWRVEHDFQEEELKKFEFLYHEWIFPHTYESLAKGKEVLDCGSGPGIQTRLYAEHAKHVYSVDLEAVKTTKEKTKDVSDKVTYINDDILNMNLNKKFDVVNCVGTMHHTDNPEATFINLSKHTKQGGILLIWVYGKEGNFLMNTIIEPLRKKFLNNASHNTLWSISYLTNLLIYPIVNTIYRLPLSFLPYFEYFKNYRKMSFKRNALNIYDKLNAPQQYFLSEKELRKWYSENGFELISCTQYMGVSWRVSGKKL